jgi:hypothetical protein
MITRLKAQHVDFLRRFLPFKDGVPGKRWLTTLVNRILSPSNASDSGAAPSR